MENTYRKTVEIISGGTVYHLRPHFALCAPAYGKTGRQLKKMCEDYSDKLEIKLTLTKMAGGDKIETNSDVESWVKSIINSNDTKIVFFTVAMCDYGGFVKDEHGIISGKYAQKMRSRIEDPLEMPEIVDLRPMPKVIKLIREKRKDIFLVGFKTTSGLSEIEQYIDSLNMLKENSCNLVFSNDVTTRLNMVVTPEEAKYHITENREEALKGLVEMAYLRSHLSFTRSTVVAGESVPWDSKLVFPALREVVNYCIDKGAYKVFRGSTVGHFACKIGPKEFLTSRRKTNFNDLPQIGLVRVVTDGEDSVIAYGSKPSVGGQSQRILFHDHQEYDCVVHFHCPIKSGSKVPIASQREAECGSMECGINTSNHLKKFGNLSAVYLDHHGPNIVFHHTINPKEVIDFIEQNFDLSQKTGGPVKLDDAFGIWKDENIDLKKLRHKAYIKDSE